MNKSRIKRNYQEPAIPFTLKAPFKPMGDQPKAIHTLVDGLNDGHWAQVLVGLRVQVRHLPWPILFSRYRGLPLLFHRIRRWRHRQPVRLRIFFLTMRCIILSAIMIIISRNPIYRLLIHILKRILQEMKKSTDCVTRPQWRCLNGGM